MWLMLQKNKPDDYVIASGKNRSVRDFVKKAFKIVGIDIAWQGKGINEVGYNKKNKKILIKIDKNYFRPNEVNNLKGDFKKAKTKLGWKPKTSFEDMIREMVSEDIKKLK